MNPKSEVGSRKAEVNAVLHCPAPPANGEAFLGEARVIVEDQFGCLVYPMVGRMRISDAGELVWCLSGLVVRQFADAVVHLDSWHPAPQPGGTFAWVRRDTPDAPADFYDDGGW